MSKKFFKILVAIFFGYSLSFLACTVEESGSKEPAPPAIKSIAVAQAPSKSSYQLGEKLNLSGLIVTAAYTNDITGIITNYTSDPAPETVLQSLGMQTVNVSYKNFSTSFSIMVIEESSSIIDPSETEQESAPTTKEKTEPKEDSEPKEDPEPQTIVVPETVTIKGISVAQNPSKKLFQVGDELDLSGLIVTAAYSNGIVGLIFDYTTEPAANSIISKSGKQSVKVSYGEFTTDFEINVVEQLVTEEIYLKSISVFQKPAKLTYEQNQTLDLTGLIVVGTYSNGINTLFADYQTSIANGTVLDELGTKTVKVKKGELEAEFSIEVVEKIIYGDIKPITVTVKDETDISIEKENIEGGIKFKVCGEYEWIQWRMNGNLAGVESEFVLNTSEIIEGNYEIFLKVKDEKGFYKSSTIYIQAGK